MRWRTQRSRERDLNVGPNRGYDPGKLGLACLSNGLWGSEGLGCWPSSAIFCVTSGSPSPEPQSLHLHNGTMGNYFTESQYWKARQMPRANKRSKVVGEVNTEDSRPQGSWKLKWTQVQQSQVQISCAVGVCEDQTNLQALC